MRRAERFTEFDPKTFQLSERGRLLVEALPDWEKVKRLKLKWAREDRAADAAKAKK